MKLNSSHIEFVFDCMKENTTKIRNIKQYLKAVLFNAPNTIDIDTIPPFRSIWRQAKSKGGLPHGTENRSFDFLTSRPTVTTFALTLPTTTAVCIAASAWKYLRAANGSRPVSSTAKMVSGRYPRRGLERLARPYLKPMGDRQRRPFLCP